MSKDYVVDFDDLCDQTEWTLNLLGSLKLSYPDLKVTLFTIPMRTSKATIERAKEVDGGEGWLRLAPHGWRHTRGECLGWNKAEAEDKILKAREMGIDAPIFKAPAWLLDTDVYEACKALDIVVADHKDFNSPIPGSRVYRYNDPANRGDVRPIHGHLTNVSGNWIQDMIKDGRLSFPTKKVRWFHPWHAAVEAKV